MGRKEKIIKVSGKFETQAGFTFIEMILAVALFSVVALSSMQILRMVLEGQQSAIASQNIQENMRYVFEAVGKEIRVATISNYDCEDVFSPSATAVNKVFNITTVNGNDALYFKNQYGECVAYYLSSDGVMMISRGGREAAATPSSLTISDLDFTVEDDGIGEVHSTQPKVTIKMDVVTDTVDEMHKKEMKLQTTISSRYYE
jgi:prepilin-type N-terminal cleavage/methylation domain-containing protein